MSTKIVIDNVSGSLAIDGTVGSAPVPSEAGATLISNSSNQWVSQAVPTSWRNRLINGDMAISQRNGDTFVSPTSSGVYTVDRWRASQNVEGSNSVYFDGNGDYLTVASNAAFDFGSGDFTVEAWVYILSTSASAIWARTNSSGIGLILYTENGNAVLQYSINGTSNKYVSGGGVSTNAWTHIAATRSGSTITMRVNGVAVSSASETGTMAAPGTTGYIGAGFAGVITLPMNGYISNLRVVKGTALYTANFTPSTVPLTAVANTSLLTCASTTFRDLSTNNFTITAAGNAAVSIAQPFGNAWSNYFDANGDYLSVPDNAALRFEAADFTIEAWIYLDKYATVATATYNGMICSRDASAAAREFLFFVGGTSSSWTNVQIYQWSSTTEVAAAFNYNFSLNTWYHVAISKQSGVLKGFVNGSLIGSSSSFNITARTTNQPLLIGARGYSGYESYFPGYISNLRIVKGTALYTTDFTPSRNTSLQAISGTSLLTCASNRFIDLSANNFTLTRAGNVAVSSTTTPIVGNKLTATVGRETGYSAYFDGSGDCAFIGGNTALYLPGNFTIECWVNKTSATNGLVAQYGGVVNLAYISWGISIYSNLSVEFWGRSSNSAPASFSAATVASAIQLNRWHHIAVSRNGNDIRLFIDGTLAASTNSSAIPYDATTARGISIGGQPTTTWGSSTIDSPFAGYISNFRVIKGSALYTANFTPSTTPLVPVTSTSLLTCASSTFADKSSNNFTVTAVGNAAVSPINPFTQAGFGRSLRWAVSTPASPASTNQALIQQRVEGSNIYDFSWGTAGARAATLSFWVNSPIAGTYCAAIQNPSLDRSYVAEYTVSAANTWERKTVNIPGPTSGFWPTDNSEGLRVSFDMGSGTNYNTTAGAWQVGNFTRTAGALSFSAQALVASNLTNNFYVVGVQLELGSVATPYEILPYGKQLESCQRYYTRMTSTSGNYVGFGAGTNTTDASAAMYIKYPVRMRASPSLNYSGVATFDSAIRSITSAIDVHVGTDSAMLRVNKTSVVSTTSQGTILTANNSSSAYIDLNAEL